MLSASLKAVKAHLPPLCFALIIYFLKLSEKKLKMYIHIKMLNELPDNHFHMNTNSNPNITGEIKLLKTN